MAHALADDRSARRLSAGLSHGVSPSLVLPEAATGLCADYAQAHGGSVLGLRAVRSLGVGSSIGLPLADRKLLHGLR
eukprot:210855-Pyramimonas_sp.AAC.1